jgi:hypothetical protein
MHAICLVIDRLHLGYLGPYGNTWLDTPALDRLAAGSTVFDQCFLSSPRLDDFYRAVLFGQHPLVPRTDRLDDSLPRLLETASVPTLLLTDDPEVADLPSTGAFGELIELDVPCADQPVETVEETRLAHCFAQLIAQLDEAKESSLLWCHLRGLAGPWDAPLELRQRLADEEDPTPPCSADVPSLLLPENFDPDIVLGHSLAYAGQVAALDQCFGAFLESIDSSDRGDDTLLIVTTPRGFPMGEHRRIGASDEALFAELTHIPLFVRMPHRLGCASRSQALVEPADLWPTLLHGFGVVPPRSSATGQSLIPLIAEEVESFRDRHVIVGMGNERAILTPAWYGRFTDHDELFVRPDDRWHANEVSSLCPDVVEQLREHLASAAQSIEAQESPTPLPLSDVLIRGLA